MFIHLETKFSMDFAVSKHYLKYGLFLSVVGSQQLIRKKNPLFFCYEWHYLTPSGLFFFCDMNF